MLAVLCAYRFFNYWTTGFSVSDEFGYFFDAAHGTIYSDRWFFGGLNIYLFRALGITNVDAFSYLLPFYLFFWTGLTLIIFYKLLRLLGFDAVVASVSLLSSFILISFVLLSLGFLTEPVGLCMVMTGIYFLARFMKCKSARRAIIFSILAACFFGFAAGTREPYSAFLIGGVVIILVLAFGRRDSAPTTRGLPQRALLAVSVLAFVIPSMFFLFVPTHAYSQQVAPLSGQLFQTIVSNPVTSGGAVTTTTTTALITAVTTTVVSNSTETITATITTTAITTESIRPPAVPFYRQYVVTNTVLIFLGGIILGWGPICFVIALAGFLMLLNRTFRRKDIIARFMFLTSLVALGSYFIVSFIYAPDPNYFSFRNYSTVIRFSDTALPAYFFTAPMFLSIISKRRKRLLGLATTTVLFLLLLVPVYETYAASSISYTAENPFQPGYRSDAVLVRDYLASLPANQPINLIGLPYGWTFTPGVQDLRSVDVYTVVPNPDFPYVTLENLTSLRWTSLYIYLSGTAVYAAYAPFVLQLLNSTAGSSPNVASPPFTVVSAHPAFRGPDFTLYQVQLMWK
jgi:hypothetical protein